MRKDSSEPPVSTLINDGTNDTDLAQQILKAKRIEYLDEGKYFNVSTKTLYPDDNGNILLASTTLNVDAVDHTRNVTPTGTRLYDLDNNTDVFTKEIKVIITSDMAFELIPHAWQRAIVAEASRDYQMLTAGDPAVDNYLAEQELKAKARARKAEASQRDSSWLDGTNNNTSNS